MCTKLLVITGAIQVSKSESDTENNTVVLLYHVDKKRVPEDRCLALKPAWEKERSGETEHFSSP